MNASVQYLYGFALQFFCWLLRSLPRGLPGKARVARRLLGASLAQTNVWVPLRDGLKLKVPSLREPVAFHALIDGAYEPEVTDFLRDFLGHGMIFVDVGANVGVFTLQAARWVGAAGRVLAFEASPLVFPYLVENLRANGAANVDALQTAVGDHGPAIVPFYAPPAEHFGMGALAEQFGVPPVAVPVDRLDHLLADRRVEHVDVLKVDVEGFEAAVFRGAQRLLSARRAPAVIFEFCDWAEERVPDARIGEAQRILEAHGYSLYRLARGSRPQPMAEILTTGYANLLALKAAD